MNAIQKNNLPIKLIIPDMENCSNSSTERKTNRILLDELLLNRLILYSLRAVEQSPFDRYASMGFLSL